MIPDARDLLAIIKVQISTSQKKALNELYQPISVGHCQLVQKLQAFSNFSNTPGTSFGQPTI